MAFRDKETYDTGQDSAASATNKYEKAAAEKKTYGEGRDRVLNAPSRKSPSNKSAPDKKAANTKSGFYKVQAGDTLWGLAQKFNTTYANLAALNGIDDPSAVITGMTLQVPNKGYKAPAKTQAPVGQPDTSQAGGKPPSPSGSTGAGAFRQIEGGGVPDSPLATGGASYLEGPNSPVLPSSGPTSYNWSAADQPNHGYSAVPPTNPGAYAFSNGANNPLNQPLGWNLDRGVSDLLAGVPSSLGGLADSIFGGPAFNTNPQGPQTWNAQIGAAPQAPPAPYFGQGVGGDAYLPLGGVDVGGGINSIWNWLMGLGGAPTPQVRQPYIGRRW